MVRKINFSLILLTILVLELVVPAYGMIKIFDKPNISNFSPYTKISKFTSDISAKPSSAEYLEYIFEGFQTGGSSPCIVKYYNSSTAKQYWGLAETSSNNPVLSLTNGQLWSQGIVFWNEFYVPGSNFTISFDGVYTEGDSPPADGYEVYLFLTPTKWNISSYWNESSNFPAFISCNLDGTGASQVQGLISLPQSATPYIIVQWDPYWQYGQKGGAGGQWNIWTVISSNNSAKVVVAIVIGTGKGVFEPRPSDIIVIKVTYDSQTNTVTGIACDLNTSQKATVNYKLPSSFTPPKIGYYVFGIGGNTGGYYANWGIIYTNVLALKPLFLYPPTKLYNVTFTKTGLPSGTSWSVTVIGKTFYGEYVNKTLTSTTNTITLTLPNGTYYYRVGSVNGYYSYPTTGEINVSGESVSVIIHFLSLPTTAITGGTATSSVSVTPITSKTSTSPLNYFIYLMILIIIILVIVIIALVVYLVIRRG